MGPMSQRIATPSRRFNSRIAMTQDVWVCWQCNGRDDVSRVCDLSLGGLFLETASPRAIGSATKGDFLAGGGQVRAEAVVSHRVAGRGLGLKFTPVTRKDHRDVAAQSRRV